MSDRQRSEAASLVIDGDPEARAARLRSDVEASVPRSAEATPVARLVQAAGEHYDAPIDSREETDALGRIYACVEELRRESAQKTSGHPSPVDSQGWNPATTGGISTTTPARVPEEAGTNFGGPALDGLPDGAPFGDVARRGSLPHQASGDRHTSTPGGGSEEPGTITAPNAGVADRDVTIAQQSFRNGEVFALKQAVACLRGLWDGAADIVEKLIAEKEGQ